MSIPILVANVLTLLAFMLHAFIGDKEIRMFEPVTDKDDGYVKQEKWTMARSGWHWVSVDLLLASIGLALINFTEYLQHEAYLLKILSSYFLCYGLAWLIGIGISKKFPKNYLKLGQWILCFVLSGLLYWGSLLLA